MFIWTALFVAKLVGKSNFCTSIALLIIHCFQIDYYLLYHIMSAVVLIKVILPQNKECFFKVAKYMYFFQASIAIADVI